MPTRFDTTIEEQRERIAADYSLKGYRVIRPEALERLPPFLGDHRPDLIVESPKEKVVVEIKAARALKGSNEMKELAARIAGQPGWRLEFIAVVPEGEEAVALRDKAWLSSVLRNSRAEDDAALRDVYLTEVMSFIIRGLADLNNIKGVPGKSTRRLAQELTFAGVLSQDLLDRIIRALEHRNSMVHNIGSYPTGDRSDTLRELCRDIARSADAKP